MKKKITLSDDFIDKLSKATVGYMPADSFDKLLSLLESEINFHYFSYQSESNMLRIIMGMYNKISFLNDSLKYPHYVEILAAVSANSNYLTDVLVRDPEYFYWITNPENLESGIDEKTFFSLVENTLNYYKTFDSKLNFLRNIKRKEILRIGVRDILKISNLKEVTEELTILARVVTNHLFNICIKETARKYGIDESEINYCLFALGKLGGNELNYSSDIDLILFYEKPEQVGKKDIRELMTEIIRLFAKSASAITANGHIFRVDFRLRPDGRNSPLCASMSEYLNYYESRGEDWERQMLIKAGFVAGSKNLFDEFINYLKPFIYPAAFSVSPKEQVKILKSNIEKNLQSDENIKLSSGGIRDIEFSVQVLQLLNGGKNKKLRTGNTLEAINELQKANALTTDEAKVFTEAYVFYRRIEHYLQLMNDKQTHTIPSESEMLNKLSSYFEFKNSTDFNNKLKKYRKTVSEIYNSIMGTDAVKHETVQLDKINFSNRKKAESDLKFLREGKGILGQKQFDKKTLDLFVKLEEGLLAYLEKAENPDVVLQNFARVIRNVQLPSIWYNEFTDKKFFESFLTICQYSQKSIDLFAEDEELQEFFLTRRIFKKFTIEELFNLKPKTVIFLLSAQFILKLIPAKKLSEQLSKYYLNTIRIISEDQIKNRVKNLSYFIAVLGSTGSGEMTFSSDIDLIFAVKNPADYPGIEKVFQDLINKLQKELAPVKVDCRLRPEGKNSQLVWDYNGYKKYIKSRLRIWEIQAFCKISNAAGDEKLYVSLLKEVKNRLFQTDKNEIKKEMLELRKKVHQSGFTSISKTINLKKGGGTIFDIEFMLYYFIMTNPENYSKYKGKGILNILSGLKNFISETEKKELRKAYKFFLNVITINQVIFNVSNQLITEDELKLKMISARTGFKSPDEFKSQLQKNMKNVRTIFNRTFED